jgi:hypothetical protein
MEGGIAGDGDRQPRWFAVRALAVLIKAPGDRIASPSSPVVEWYKGILEGEAVSDQGNRIKRCKY